MTNQFIWKLIIYYNFFNNFRYKSELKIKSKITPLHFGKLRCYLNLVYRFCFFQMLPYHCWRLCRKKVNIVPIAQLVCERAAFSKTIENWPHFELFQIRTALRKPKLPLLCKTRNYPTIFWALDAICLFLWHSCNAIFGQVTIERYMRSEKKRFNKFDRLITLSEISGLIRRRKRYCWF